MLRPIPKKILYSGTITGLRISSVDGTAFLDACAALVPYADAESDIYIYDSVGAFLKATLKAQGTGETLGGQLVANYDFSGTWGTYDVPQSWGFQTAGNISETTYLEKDDVNDRLRIVSDGAGMGIHYGFASTVGTCLKYTTDTHAAAGRAYFAASGAYFPLHIITTTGIQSSYFTADSADMLCYLFRLVGYTCDSTFNSAGVKQVLTPSANGVTLQASKWDATENFGVKASGFKYNEASYAVRVFKAR